MSYLDRLQPFVTLTSPKGNVFTPEWKGDKITGAKKVARFEYPNTDGTVVQDLGLKGFDWPMTLYFADGTSDNDTEAWRFLSALSEKGSDGRAIWTVVHPVYGSRSLQPLQFELGADPTESGGLTVVTTSWIEPILTAASPSSGEYAGAADAQGAAMNATATAQAVANTDQTTMDKIAAARNAWSMGIGAIQGAINTANAAVANIQAAIQSYLVQPFLDVASIAGQFQQLMATPGLLIGDLYSKVTSFGTMMTATLGNGANGQGGTDTSPAGKNAVAAQEAMSLAILYGIEQAITNGTLTTRAQAVQAISDLTTWLAYMRNALDTAQAAFSGARLDLQYFSQSKGYADGLATVAYLQRYLQSKIFDLAATKVYTLQTGRATLEIAMSEYGVQGQAWDDVLYDKFIAANNLHGSQILWLPAGTKVTVYL